MIVLAGFVQNFLRSTFRAHQTILLQCNKKNIFLKRRPFPKYEGRGLNRRFAQGKPVFFRFEAANDSGVMFAYVDDVGDWYGLGLALSKGILVSLAALSRYCRAF